MGILGLWAGATSRPRWSSVALLGILSLAAWLRLWSIERNGFGTEYYAAGVLSMMISLHNFFFVAFDPAGFVSVDKPPVALWIQVASAELFGFSGFSVILPQVLEGLATILLLHRLVARRFGQAAGLIAALVLATMPISVAVDRSSNTDSCLVLVLLLATAAMIRAIERRSAGWVLAAMATIGIGFNVKMAAALGVVPAFCLAYLLAAPVEWRRRCAQLVLAGAATLVVAFSWFAIYDLVPADARPYAGSTSDNSMLQMVFVQYGIDRFIPHPGRGERRGPPVESDAAAPATPTAAPWAGGMAADHVPIGPLRFADPRLGGQIGWFFPLAAIGLAALVSRRRRRGGGPATPAELDLVIWVGWALAYGIVFSFAGGIFHAYYVVAMAPPVAALTGAGLVALWQHYRAGGRRSWLLPAGLAATGLWQAWLDHASLGAALWIRILFGLLLAGTAFGVAGLVAARQQPARPALAALGLGLAAVMVTPFAWALSPVLGKTNISFPAADIALIAPGAAQAAMPRWARDEHPDTHRLLAYIQQHRGETRYLLATQTAPVAAPLILDSGAPVMAVGGYSGTDPIVTPEGLGALVAAGEVRFFLVREGGRGGRGGSRRGGASGGTPGTNAAAPVRLMTDWVKQHGRLVDPALWAPEGARPTEPQGQPAQYLLYDLMPTTSASE